MIAVTELSIAVKHNAIEHICSCLVPGFVDFNIVQGEAGHDCL